MSIQFSAKMRKKTYQGFFILTVISLAGVPAIFKFVFDRGQSIAVIDGIAVTPREYQEAISAQENHLAAIRAQFGGGMHLSDDILKSLGINTNVREAALDELINERIVLSVADALHMHLDKEYITRALRDPQSAYKFFGSSVPPYLYNSQGYLDAERLKIFLQRQGKTIESFDAMIEAKMKQGLVLAIVKEAAMVSAAALKESALQKYAPKTFAVSTIAYAPYIKAEEKTQVTPEEIQQFFAKHNASEHRYWSPEKRTGVVWAFKQKSYDGSSVKEAKNFEERFTKDTQGLLQVPAAAFATFAQQKNGTKHDLVVTKESNEAGARELFALTPGRRAVYFADGVGHIVELVSVEKSGALPLDKAKAQVIVDIYQERAKAKVAKALRDIAAGDAQGAEHLGTPELKSFKAKWNPADADSLSALQKQGIDTAKMMRMFMKKQAFTGSTDSLGYKVELIDVGPVDQKLYLKDRAVMISSLEQDSGQRVAYDFIASLREHATIVMNKSLLKGI